MFSISIPAAIAQLRDRARRCRHAAFRMQPSEARTALERLAIRWDVIAETRRRHLELTTAANEP